MKKIILLNGGTQTRTAFQLGVDTAQFASYKSKELILHITQDLQLVFLDKNTPIDFTDAYVFTRLRATDSHFCGILYEHFRANGIKASDPINSSFRMSEEKIAQMPRLARAGIKIPQTIIAREESYEANKEYILSNIQFPCVFKTDGSQGRAVFKVESAAELEERIAEKKKYELFLIQELIPNTFDTRTLTVYGEILGTIKRSATNGSFYNNVAQGAKVSAYTLTEEEQTVAIKATNACELDFGGVDMIHTDNGPIVLEVNKSPQIKGFESIYGENTVFKHIAQKIEKDLL